MGSDTSEVEPELAQLCETETLDLSHMYARLQSVLADDDLEILGALTQLLHRQGVDDAIKRYVEILVFFGLDKRFMRLLLEREVASTRDAFSLFRETSAISLIISTYMRLIGAEYLNSALSPILQRVLTQNILPDDHSSLLLLCDDIFQSLSALLEDVPPAFLDVCTMLVKVARRHFPNDEYTALVGLLLLRFICPAIASPVQYETVQTDGPLGLDALRTFALLSKIILMSGTGARFPSSGSCADLNAHLARYVGDALSFLSLILKRDGREKGKPIPLSSSTGHGHKITVYCDEQQLSVPVFSHSTGRDIREVLLRMLCNEALDKDKLDALRFKYQGYLLFLIEPDKQWDVLKFVGLISGKDSSHEVPLLVEDEETIEYFDGDQYSLFFVHLDEPYLSQVKEHKQLMTNVQSQVRVKVRDLNMAFRVERDTTVADIERSVIAKLCMATFGNEDKDNIVRTRQAHHKFCINLLKAASPLNPEDPALRIKSFFSTPEMLEFKRGKGSFLHVSRGSVVRDVMVKVNSADGTRTLTVARETSPIEIMDLMMQKKAKEHLGSSDGVRALVKVFGGFSNQWLHWKAADRNELMRRVSGGDATTTKSGGAHKRRSSFGLLGRRKKTTTTVAKSSWQPCPLYLQLDKPGLEFELREPHPKDVPTIQATIRTHIMSSELERECVCIGGRIPEGSCTFSPTPPPDSPIEGDVLPGSVGRSSPGILRSGNESPPPFDHSFMRSQSEPTGLEVSTITPEPARINAVRHSTIATSIPMVVDEREEMFQSLLRSFRGVTQVLSAQEFEISRILLEKHGMDLADLHRFQATSDGNGNAEASSQAQTAAAPPQGDGDACASDPSLSESSHVELTPERIAVLERLANFHSVLVALDGMLASDVIRRAPSPPMPAADLQNGWTPLHVAAHGGDLEVIEMILQGCRDVNVENDDGTTALHYFVRGRYPDGMNGRAESILHGFIRKGADLNARNRYKETPLHCAIVNRRVHMVRALLGAGADPNVSTVKMSALELAIQVGPAEVVELLVRAGAQIDPSAIEKMTQKCADGVREKLDELFGGKEREGDEGEGESTGACESEG